jgi:hypothetical protein
VHSLSDPTQAHIVAVRLAEAQDLYNYNRTLYMPLVEAHRNNVIQHNMAVRAMQLAKT